MSSFNADPESAEQTSPSQEEPAVSTTSIDSSTLLLESHPTQSSEPTSRPQPTRQATDLKQCWICYVDETEDTPTSSRWRSPCPCALVAHESCLLDWIADLEAPSRTRTETPKIQCPQCKKDIYIARPRSLVVEATQSVQRLGMRLVIPGLVFTLAGSLWTGALAHGVFSICLVFGQKEGRRMLAGGNVTPGQALAIPCIPLALIAARTSLARYFVWIPFTIYAPTLLREVNITGDISHGLQQLALWPWNPQLAFSLLPVVMNCYNLAFNALFAKKQIEWANAIKPRATEGNADANAQEAVPAGDDRLGDIFNFEIEIEEDEPVPAPAAQPAAQPVVVAPADPTNPANPAIPQPPPAQPDQPRRNLTVSGTHIADLLMGSLAFPLIASAMGSLLQFALPTSLTSTTYYTASIFRNKKGGVPPFLSQQWARSLVGGCLFVVVKDALVLYSKYRTARDHGLRRVRNWDKALGKAVD